MATENPRPESSATILIYGEITRNELLEINRLLEPTGITADEPINKADLIHEALRLVFSDFNTVDFLRDQIIGSGAIAALLKIKDYFKNRRRLDNELSFDKQLNFGVKTFTIYITCHWSHLDTIDEQINYALPAHLLNSLPDHSRIFVAGKEDGTITVTILERGTGKQYPLQ